MIYANILESIFILLWKIDVFYYEDLMCFIAKIWCVLLRRFDVFCCETLRYLRFGAISITELAHFQSPSWLYFVRSFGGVLFVLPSGFACAQAREHFDAIDRSIWNFLDAGADTRDVMSSKRKAEVMKADTQIIWPKICFSSEQRFDNFSVVHSLFEFSIYYH